MKRCSADTLPLLYHSATFAGVSMEKKFYVYVHRRLTDGSIFYVGKGQGGRASSSSNRNKKWHEISQGGWQHQIMFRTMHECCALSIERMLILVNKQSVCNLTTGGQGVSGLRHSEKTKAILREKSNAQWGREDAIIARRLKTLEQWSDPIMKEKLKASARKRWDDPQQRKMIGDIQRGKQQSPEHAEKSRNAKVGFQVSDETRARLKEAWVRRKAKTIE